MKMIIPMAGIGSRMRPHTLTTPKPLVPIVGKPIVQRLVEDIAKVCKEPIEEIGFIIGEFGPVVEGQLQQIAESIGAKAKIYYQKEKLGTAHAILCARESLDGNVIVAFADTLFRADFELDASQDGIIWVKKVDNPSSFGVVKLDSNNAIIDFIEKPSDFISDLAIIGIYYFKDGANLENELQYLIDHEVKVNGEFQLTDALENMKNKGIKFVPGRVEEWLDCGNKDATVHTNQRYLEFVRNEDLVSKSAVVDNSVIIPPVYIGENAEVYNTVLGPYVSVGARTIIHDSRIQNSIIQRESKVVNANMANSMIGNFVSFAGKTSDYSIGDYNEIIE